MLYLAENTLTALCLWTKIKIEKIICKYGGYLLCSK